MDDLNGSNIEYVRRSVYPLYVSHWRSPAVGNGLAVYPPGKLPIVKLPQSFYLREDVVEISRDLLGKVLCTRIEDKLAKAIITETEAYAGVDDKASHAYGGRRTRRTEPMFGPGGTAYVYLCYGIHHLFNVVTNAADIPHAVLVRAGVPLEGAATMLERRNKQQVDKSLLAGPGSLAQGLGIETGLTGTSLVDGQIWIEDHSIVADEVTVGPRVGIDYAGEDAARPYRFRITSTAKSGTICIPQTDSKR